MIEKGYVATSIDEICAEAGVTKGSFFHYFTSKDHLGRDLLERYLGQRMAEHEARACETEPLRRLYAHLDAIIRRCEDPRAVRGSLLGIFTQELSRTHPDIGRLCADAFGRWTDSLACDLDEAKARYAPQLKLDARSLAEHFVAVFEGSLILARAQGDVRVLQQNVRHFRGYVEMLFGQPAEGANDVGGCFTPRAS